MVLRNFGEVSEERPLFQLFFLKDDENQSVEVEEVKEINFEEVRKRLERGESVFITRKGRQRSNTILVAEKDEAELWYLSGI